VDANATRTSITRRACFGLSAAILSVTLAGCSAQEMPRLGMPDPATVEGNSMLFLWQTSWIAALIVGAITWGLIAWAVVAYSRRRRPGYPEQTRYNMPIEILYTVLPFIMIGVLFYFTARDESRLTRVSNDYAHTVNVVGFRWAWTFNYVEEKAYDIGVPANSNTNPPTDASYTGPTLWLPVNEKTRFVLSSPDVIHSFFVPAFLFKMDVMPGRNNQFELTPNKLGTYAGKCAELCGIDHSRMLFNVKVVTKKEYLAHIAALKARGQSGQVKSSFNTSKASKGQGFTTVGGKGDVQ